MRATILAAYFYTAKFLLSNAGMALDFQINCAISNLVTKFGSRLFNSGLNVALDFPKLANAAAVKKT